MLAARDASLAQQGEALAAARYQAESARADAARAVAALSELSAAASTLGGLADAAAAAGANTDALLVQQAETVGDLAAMAATRYSCHSLIVTTAFIYCDDYMCYLQPPAGVLWIASLDLVDVCSVCLCLFVCLWVCEHVTCVLTLGVGVLW